MSKGYKYLILGDDSLDTSLDIYNKYKEIMTKFGLSISTSKCTQSKDGLTEFAKRYFSPEGELTGIPVDILSEVKHKPEQFLELVRLMRSRGYCDKQLFSGIKLLTEGWKIQPLLLDLLSLPIEITGAHPLRDVDSSLISI